MEALLQAVVVLLVFVLTVAVVGLAWFVLWHIVLRKLPFIQDMLKKKQQLPPPVRSDGGSGSSSGGRRGSGPSSSNGSCGGDDVIDGNSVAQPDHRSLPGKPHSS